MDVQTSSLAWEDLSCIRLNPSSVRNHRGQRTYLAVTPHIRGCPITQRLLGLQTPPMAWEDLSCVRLNPSSVRNHRGQRTDLAVTPQIRGCPITQRLLGLWFLTLEGFNLTHKRSSHAKAEVCRPNNLWVMGQPLICGASAKSVLYDFWHLRGSI